MHTKYDWHRQVQKNDTPASFSELTETILEPLALGGVSNIKLDPANEEYCSIKFDFNGKTCLFRQAKTTPKKIGQFVTIWKRAGRKSEISPFDTNDGIDTVFIASFTPDHKGFFIFQCDLLTKKNVFSHNGVGGKRAFRVYAPWTHPTAKQATEAKRWQTKTFIDLQLSTEAILSTTKHLI